MTSTSTLWVRPDDFNDDVPASGGLWFADGEDPSRHLIGYILPSFPGRPLEVVYLRALEDGRIFSPPMRAPTNCMDAISSSFDEIQEWISCQAVIKQMDNLDKRMPHVFSFKRTATRRSCDFCGISELNTPLDIECSARLRFALDSVRASN